MNRVAVITDIHANLPALEATLAEIERLAVDAVYCGGDLVGYGPQPNEVCALIEERAIPTIYGNYDYAIGRDLEDCGCAYIDRHDQEIGQLSVDWTLAHTSRPSKDFMRELPFDLRFELAGKRVRLVHGSPRKVNEYLFEDKPARTFERIAAPADCDVLVFGHTHKPWIRDYGGVRFVNCAALSASPRTATHTPPSPCSKRLTTMSPRRSTVSRTTRSPSRARCGAPGCRRSSPTNSSLQPDGAAGRPRSCAVFPQRAYGRHPIPADAPPPIVDLR